MRHRRFAEIAAFALALLWLVGPARAQESAVDFIEPRVDRQTYQRLIQSLNLAPDQRMIVELAFDDYAQTLTSLAQELDRNATAAGRDNVQAALGGKARFAPDEIKQLRLAVLKTYEPAGPAADAALETFISAFEVLLTGEQMPAFDQALKQLRREIILHPRQKLADAQEYAGDGVDLLQLLDAAMQDGGELQGIDAEAINPLIQLYEQQLDSILIATAGDYRSNRLQRKAAQIEKNPVAIGELEQAALELWKQLYELNLSFVKQIGDIAAAQAGEQAQQRWLERYDRASFPWLFPRRKPDRQIEWIRQEVSGEALAKASEAYSQYEARRRALTQRAIQLMLEGRTQHQTMLYSMMDASSLTDRACRDLYVELLKNTGEQANLDSETAGQLESMLSQSQREKLREAMKRPDVAGRRR